MAALVVLISWLRARGVEMLAWHWLYGSFGLSSAAEAIDLDWERGKNTS
jgi:hypothetical protein